MSELPLHVTETEVWADAPFPDTPELEALQRWAARLGFDAVSRPLSEPIRRDVARRRVYFGAWDDHGPDFVHTEFVQLESPPPPWPPQIARYIRGAGDDAGAP